MASAIGLRIYEITIQKRGEPSGPIALTSGELGTSFPDFLQGFIQSHSVAIQDNSLERSWYFDSKAADGKRTNIGYIHYGTFGFESNFVDTKTKKHNYRRMVTDVEEIPLFYEFWCPDRAKKGLVTFQSFQGRSCIQLVMSSMRINFEKLNPDYAVIFRKLMPNDAKGSAYFSAPVKQLRLIRRNTSSDIAARYGVGGAPDKVKLEIVISARRNKQLGDLTSLLNNIKSSEKSVLTHDGLDFPEAVAEIRVGKRARKVGVLGINSDAGVIDISDVIERGLDGHPTFDSLRRESGAVLRDIYETITGGTA